MLEYKLTCRRPSGCEARNVKKSKPKKQPKKAKKWKQKTFLRWQVKKNRPPRLPDGFFRKSSVAV
jgi:hypothetical protein